jgi:hypothetical protein
MLEQKLAAAARDGELDGGPLKGKPLPDLDRQRPAGWWAEQFTKRELSHDRRVAAEADAAQARIGFWKSESIDELHELVAAANRAIAAANINLVAADQLDLFVVSEIVDRWRAVRTR